MIKVIQTHAQLFKYNKSFCIFMPEAKEGMLEEQDVSKCEWRGLFTLRVNIGQEELHAICNMILILSAYGKRKKADPCNSFYDYLIT